MEHKLKSIFQILEDEKKNNDKREKIEKVKVEKKDSAEQKQSFCCEKKDSASFKYAKQKYNPTQLTGEQEKYFMKANTVAGYNDLFRKNIFAKEQHGKETVKLFDYVFYYRRDKDLALDNYKPFKKELNLKYIQKLINKGADVNYVNSNCSNPTCLFCAINIKNFELINLLLKNGANPNYFKLPDHLSPYKTSIQNIKLRKYIILNVFENAILNRETDDAKTFKDIFKDMVENYDADIYMKNLNGHYIIADYINEQDLSTKKFAKKLLEPYGFTEEDYNLNQATSAEKMNENIFNNNENKKNKVEEDKKLDKQFDEEFQIPENL